MSSTDHQIAETIAALRDAAPALTETVVRHVQIEGVVGFGIGASIAALCVWVAAFLWRKAGADHDPEWRYIVAGFLIVVATTSLALGAISIPAIIHPEGAALLRLLP